MTFSASVMMYWLPLCIFVCFHGTVVGMDQFQTPLRPSDGEDKSADKNLDNPDLGDLPSIMKKYYPKEKHLKVIKLISIIGDEFEPAWMAIKRPDWEAGDTVPATGTNDTIEHTRQTVQALMTSRNMTIGDSNMEPLVQFLSTLSTCTVRFEWSDLGELFWPRFILSGLCTSESSCSWPSGMTCMPGRLKALRVLRWRCKRRGGSAKRKAKKRDKKNKRFKKRKADKMACSWKLIPYHVPIDCACSC